MISVTINRDDPVLLHDQVAADIRRAIAEGEAGPGERLDVPERADRERALEPLQAVGRRIGVVAVDERVGDEL